jgi:hypothetical protein
MRRQNARGEAAAEAARRQATFRQVNERIGELFDLAAAAGDPFPIACECGNAGCLEMLALTEAEYDAVRRNPRRFAVVPGHEIPAVEHVVASSERFVVVEKRQGGD